MEIKKDKNSRANLNLEWIYGIRKDIFPNIFVLDYETIVYPASNYVVIYNHTKRLPLNQQQTFISGSQFSQGITNIAVFNINKKYIAVSEELADGVTITPYLISSYLGIHNYPTKLPSFSVQGIKLNIDKTYNIEFSKRDKGTFYFASAVFIQEPLIILWNWDISDDNKEKEGYMYPISLYLKKDKIWMAKNNSPSTFFNISFSVFKNENFCLISNHYFQYFLINDKKPEMLFTYDSFEQDTEILSHNWLVEGYFTIVTKTTILVFNMNSKELIQVYDNVNNTSPWKIINQIHSNENFFVSFGNEKLVRIYKKNEEGEYESEFETTIELESRDVKDTSVIYFDFHSFAFSHYDQTLSEIDDQDRIETYVYFVTTTNNDLLKFTVKVNNLNNYIIGTEHVLSVFHSDSIEGIDLCIQKPYVISVSKDKTLKIWNYMTRTLVLNKIFEEEMHSVAYHPSGMHALVSFTDKIRPINVYYDDVANSTQTGIPAKKAKDLKFSSGGQFFVFDSQLKIEVWDFLNMHIVSNGQQTTRSKINSINFKNDNTSILIACVDSIYEWKIGDIPQRHQQIKSGNYTSSIYIPNSKNEIIAAIDDGGLKKMNELSSVNTVENKFDYYFSNLFALRFSKYLLGSVNYENTKSNNKGSNSVSNNKEIGGNSNSLSLGNLNDDINQQKHHFIPIQTTKAFSHTSCLKLIYDRNYLNPSNSLEPLVPSHIGDTNRVRINYDENIIVTCGSDGCINIFSLNDGNNDSEEGKSSLITDKAAERFTSVVLLKKSKIKEFEIEKIGQPEKKEEIYKNLRTHNLEKKETLQKGLDKLKNDMAQEKRSAQDHIQNKKSELERIIEESGKKLNDLTTDLKNSYEKNKNDFQIQLTEMQRKIEFRREQLRKEKENFKRKMQDYKRKHYEELESFKKQKNEEVDTLQKHEKELDDEIKILSSQKIYDINDTNWLNNKILVNLDENINELKRGIDNLKNYHKQQENKLKEKKEKQIQDLDALEKEITQIKEQKQFQFRRKEQLTDQKKVNYFYFISHMK